MRNRSNYGIVGPQQTVTQTSTGLMTSAVDIQLLKSSGNWVGPPSAPTITGVTIADSAVSVAFTTPNNNGSVITSYTVTSNPGGFVGVGSSSPITVSGLTNGVTYTFTVRATNGVGIGAASSPSTGAVPAAFDIQITPAVNGVTLWTYATNGSLSISTAGEYTLTFGNTQTKVVKMWGGAGRASSAGSTSWGQGAAGGAAVGTMTFYPGTTYIVRVGGAGASGTAPANAYGAGNGGGTFSVGAAGSGGGYTGLFNTSVSQANALLMAGGGGGGASQRSDGLGGRHGGAGGGTTGQAGGLGPDGVTQTTGGTQSTGGSGVAGGGSGSALQGGNGTGGGSGGGGGYFGGGGGGPHGDGGHGAAGGSGYFNPTVVSSATLYQGSVTTPGNSSDPDRPTNAGAGNTSGSASFPGAFIIKA